MASPVRIPNLLGEPNCCEVSCAHLDCKSVREHAARGCPLCGERLRRGDEYHYVDVGANERIAHFRCMWRRWLLDAGVPDSEIDDAELPIH